MRNYAGLVKCWLWVLLQEIWDHGLHLARFPVPGTIFLLLTIPIRELLITAKVCVLLLHPSGYCAMLFIVVVHKHHSRRGLLVDSLVWLIVWCVQVPWKSVLREETFRSVQAQRSLGPASEIHTVFSNKDLTSTSMGQPRATAQASMSVSLLDDPHQPFKKGLPYGF